MMICSSNNTAVQNITEELPLKSQISGFEEKADYFSEVAEQNSDGSHWGLLSGVLGKSENISDFISKVDGSENSLIQYLEKKRLFTLEEWESSVSNFNEKLRQVENEKKRIEAIKIKNKKLKDYLSEKKKMLASTDLTLLKNKAENLKESILEFTQIQTGHFKTLHLLSMDKKTLEEKPPGFWHRIFNTKKNKKYHQQMRILDFSISGEKAKTDYFGDQIASRKQQINNCFLKIENIRKRLINLESEINNLSIELNNAEEYQDTNFIKDEEIFWANLDSKETQEICPWYTKRLKKLQSELFLEALKLNESFIHTANGAKTNDTRGDDESVGPITENIKRFAGLFNDRHITVPYAMAAKVWQSMFLIVPVFSGTFASVQSMCRNLVNESIPWLFIDEAGQALPQMACGALWRAKRAVIVGDPLQIEPVNASPPLLSYHLSESFGLESSDLAGGASVQVLADRLNKYGTELKNKNNSIWVGSPLRVHRRCINPMFQIANEISYNGSMVCSTIERNSNLLMQTGFLDIKGNVRDGQYIEEQGLAVLKLVQAEFDNNSDIGITPSLYIISPFNIVAKNIKQLLIKHLVSNKFDKDSIYDWVHDSVGTVHTFQGKEADGVIMCLGCDKTKVGAARWAASSPNILNVALTRAKYRFIAIGDKDIWLKQKYFSELSQLN